MEPRVSRSSHVALLMSPRSLNICQTLAFYFYFIFVILKVQGVFVLVFFLHYLRPLEGKLPKELAQSYVFVPLMVSLISPSVRISTKIFVPVIEPGSAYLGRVISLMEMYFLNYWFFFFCFLSHVFKAQLPKKCFNEAAHPIPSFLHLILRE